MIWLLDTNILIYSMNNLGDVRTRVNRASQEGRIVTSILVAAELFYGVECSARKDANRKRLEKALARMEVLPMTNGAAERFGQIKSTLRLKGLAKGDVDLLIAATALDLDATLVTNDGGLTDGTIPDLRVENWAPS